MEAKIDHKILLYVMLLVKNMKKCNHTAYKWYIKVMNGTLPNNLYINISDSVKYKHGTDVMINRRKELYESMINSDNISIMVFRTYINLKNK